MILFLLQIYFNIFKKVFPLKNTIKRTFSALSRTSFSHCGKFSPKLKILCVNLVQTLRFPQTGTIFPDFDFFRSMLLFFLL